MSLTDCAVNHDEDAVAARSVNLEEGSFTVGWLDGLRVVQIGGIGPGPFAGMIFAGWGAEVVRVTRPKERVLLPGSEQLDAGKLSVEMDLREPADRRRLLDLLDHADVLIEGFRPGVMERWSLGPDEVRDRCPDLVFARITGHPRDQANAGKAGHDINFLAETGALATFGHADREPVPPLNLLADFAAGGYRLTTEVLAALFRRDRTGGGAVVDVAMVEAVRLTMTMLFAQLRSGAWDSARGANVLDGAAPFYRTYRCADGRYVAVGAVEPHFYATLLDGLGVDARAPIRGKQFDRRWWPTDSAFLQQCFQARAMAEWCDEVFRDLDACVSPVRSLDEAALDPMTGPGDVAVGGGTSVDALLQRWATPRKGARS